MLGIDPKTIPYKFSRVEEAAAIPKTYDRRAFVSGTVPNKEERLRAHPAGAAWLKEWCGEGYESDFEWDGAYCNWLNISVDVLQQVFTFEELARIWQGTIIMSRLSEWIGEKHSFLRRIEYSHWHYGCMSDWNLTVDHLDGLRRLRIDLPDFDLRLTHTRTINTAASSEHVPKLWLDASFGLLLYYKGEHVLTVGFALSYRGILVAQVQLRKKKGNRFLFKLKRHYVDIALDILRDAFGDCLWLATGESNVAAIIRAYGKQPCGMTEDDKSRIRALYNRSLEGFERDRAVEYKHEDRLYVRLLEKFSVAKAA